MQSNRVLFIDAYDSFSNSIINLLETELLVTVTSIKIDDARFVLNDATFFHYLHGFDAVVAGPGPGHPANPGDVGLIAKLWHLPSEHLLPVLGICLGFQSLCLAHGARVERLKEPRHGILALVTHRNSDVFCGTGKVVATQYHSLHVQLDTGKSDKTRSRSRWDPSPECSQLLPLAWDMMNIANGPILMGVSHMSKPYWGVQYHPESVCTNKEGRKLVVNWWDEVCRWHTERPAQGIEKLSLAASSVEDDSVRFPPFTNGNDADISTSRCEVAWTSVKISKEFDVAGLVDSLRQVNKPWPMLLESGTRNDKPVNAETGRFSIIGLPESSSTHVRYTSHEGRLAVSRAGDVVCSSHSNIQDAFSHIDDAVKSQKASGGPAATPFWGGFIGYASYEAGLETIHVTSSPEAQGTPDLWFVFVNRSIVVDHVDGIAYVQSLHAHDDAWSSRMQQAILRQSSAEHGGKVTPSPTDVRGTVLQEPHREEYCEKVRTCQSRLRAGESYELCLTDQTRIQSSVDPWNLYRLLRRLNPAPFGSYLQLQIGTEPGLAVVGSSPERFLSWTRNGKCQFRPIKGTVKKGPMMTRAKAEALLASAKERAENLMIVDLIRHDLSGVPGVRQVRVPKLMSVEEYETVYQLVSVIEGDFDASTTGCAALMASLPPGSMTGAPKKRSCELLKAIERDQPRGLYSGVLGYFDVGGGGDFSVVIRTAFKWGEGEWRVGAGGAVTSLSDPQSEWEEMLAKRESVLNCFSL